MNSKPQTFAHTKDEQAGDASKINDIHDALSRSTLSAKSGPADHSVDASTKTRSEGGVVSTKFFVIIISLVMGLYEIGGLATFMYQKDVLKIEPQTMQMLIGIIAIPWCIKPVFGYLFDELIHRVKRVKYVIMCVAVVRFLILTFIHRAEYIPTAVFYAAIFLNSICSLTENILSEYMLVVSSKQENEKNPDAHANHLPIFYGFRALGQLVGNFWGGRLIQYYNIKMAFLVGSAFPLATIAMAWLYRGRPITSQRDPSTRSLKKEFATIKTLIFRDKVFQMALFVFLANAMPSFDVLYTFYMTDYLKLTTEDLSDCAAFATVCYITGLLAYSYYFSRMEPYRFYVATNFGYWCVNLSFMMVVWGKVEEWGLSNKLFCMLNFGACSLIGELNYMPVIAVWCAVCPKNLEATSITLFTGLINLSWNVGNYFGSFLMWALEIHKDSFDKVWIVVMLQTVYLLAVVIGLLFVKFPSTRQADNEFEQVKDRAKPVEIVD